MLLTIWKGDTAPLINQFGALRRLPQRALFLIVLMTAFAASAAAGEYYCTASDASYVQYSDCYYTTWQVRLSYDYLSSYGGYYNGGSLQGRNVCVAEHLDCNGSNVPFRLSTAERQFYSTPGGVNDRADLLRRSTSPAWFHSPTARGGVRFSVDEERSTL